MSGIKEIKNKIASIEETQKITGAMYLIASTKLRKARIKLEETLPYFDAIKSDIGLLFSHIDTVNSPFFLPEGVAEEDDIELPGTYGYLVITADKGMAGDYNQKVVKEAQKQLARHKDNALFVVGEHGRTYFTSHGYTIEKSFLYSSQNPDMDRARVICDDLVERYLKGELRKIYLIYTDFGNGIAPACVVQRLLPFHRAVFHDKNETVEAAFEFIPSVEEVLDHIIENYVVGYVYSAFVDSFCSEQQARMTAMDNANQNARDMLNHLRLLYNHARQGAITQEITEISSGAKALHKIAEQRLV